MAVLCAVAGCERCRSGSDPVPPRGSSVGDARSAASGGDEGPGIGLVVGSERGLVLFSSDGGGERVLSEVPAGSPRLVSRSKGGAIVYLRRRAAELRMYDLETQRDTSVAYLPTELGVDCGGQWDEPYQPAEYVYGPEAFVFDPQRGDVCIELGDRNPNMRNVEVRHRVDLSTGETRSAVTMAPDCPEHSRKVPKCPSLDGPDRGGLEPMAFGEWLRAEGYDEFDGVFGERWRAETRSPSGRWVVFSGPESRGDYVWRPLFLFDTRRTVFFPIPAVAAWPEPVSAAQMQQRVGREGGTLEVPGSERVGWLGREGAFIVGERLVVPGEGSAPLSGDPMIYGTRRGHPACHLSGDELHCE